MDLDELARFLKFIDTQQSNITSDEPSEFSNARIYSATKYFTSMSLNTVLQNILQRHKWQFRPVNVIRNLISASIKM